MRYLLAGVLVVVAAGVSRADGVVRIGMTEKEVGAALGEPWFSSHATTHTFYIYMWVDAIGGLHFLYVFFDPKGTVVQVEPVHYRPLAARPPWLECVWDAFSPPQK